MEMEKKLTSTGVKVQKSEEHNEKADVQKLEPQPAPVTKQSDGPKAEPTKAPRPIQPVRIAEAGEGNDSMIIIRDETTPTVADATAIVQEPIQREERGKGGKRRIIPQPLGAPVAAVSTDQTSQPAGNIWTALSQSESQATPTASLLPPAKRSRTQVWTFSEHFSRPFGINRIYCSSQLLQVPGSVTEIIVRHADPLWEYSQPMSLSG